MKPQDVKHAMIQAITEVVQKQYGPFTYEEVCEALRTVQGSLDRLIATLEVTVLEPYKEVLDPTTRRSLFLDHARKLQSRADAKDLGQGLLQTFAAFAGDVFEPTTLSPKK